VPRRSRYRREPPFSLFAFQDIIAAVTGVMILLTMLLVLDLVTQVVGDPSAAQAQLTDAPAPPIDPELDELIERRDALAEQVAAMSGGSTPAVVTPSRLAFLEQEIRLIQKQLEQQQRQNAAAAERQATLAAAAELSSEALDNLVRELEQTQEKLHAELSRTRITLLDGDTRGKQPWFLLCSARGITAARVTGQRELRPDAAFLGDDHAEALWAWVAQRSPEQDIFVLLVESDGVDRFESLQRGLRQRRFEVGWDLASAKLSAAMRTAEETSDLP